MKITRFLALWVLALPSAILQAAPTVRVAAFQVDATPPLGSPLCDGLVPAGVKVDDPLTCRGVVILPDGQQPIVLCVLDWVGIGNGGHDAWRGALAKAAGTTPRRVAIHATHAHDAPGCDFDAATLLETRGIDRAAFDVPFLRQTIDSAASSLKESLAAAQPITHVGYGKAKVEKVASNRRILGHDGLVKWVRWSASKDPQARDQPEGTIDPFVYVISFWSQDRPVVSLSYYACHPQSHYRQGAISCDFPGIARNTRQDALGIPCLHFNGAGGNVTAGKYNDGDPANRAVLAGRMAQGMAGAWDSSIKVPLNAGTVSWGVESVALPPANHLDEQRLIRTLDSDRQPDNPRVAAARRLAWLERVKSGHKVDLACLTLGPIRVLHMPGELFVEYQIAAHTARPDLFVAMAAYGDYGMGYIGTKVAYGQGGYEASPGASLVAPEVEDVLMPAIRRLLD